MTTERKENSGQQTAARRRGGSRPIKPRIEPVKKKSWTEAQQTLLRAYERSGHVYNVFTTMANHPDLARDWLTFGSHILRRSSLSDRDREIVILRIGWLCNAEYEWAQHVRIGKRAGLTEDDLRRISQGPLSGELEQHDRYC